MKLKQSSLMKHLMDNIKDNIYFMDQEGRIILINKEGAQWLGYSSPEEVIGKTDLDIFTKEHGRAAFEDEQRIMQTGVPILGKEEKETWADGNETWVSTSKMPLRDDSGEIVGTFGISRNITEQKKAAIRAERFAEENRRFREEMEEELLMAGELQKTFFPASYPTFPEGAGDAERAVVFKHLHHASGVVSGATSPAAAKPRKPSPRFDTAATAICSGATASSSTTGSARERTPNWFSKNTGSKATTSAASPNCSPISGCTIRPARTWPPTTSTTCLAFWPSTFCRR